MSTRTRPHPPSVELLLAAARPRVGAGASHEAIVDVARAVVADERELLATGAEPRSVTALVDEMTTRLDGFGAPGLAATINATGVIVHTNLGRAPWPQAAIEAAGAAAHDYLLLELDRDTGRRGARFRTAEEHLIALTGAEDALVTNNNAAAVALAVGVAGRSGVVVSRGELVEIGGGVRIPEIVRRAGARLVEVGTTNRTRVADFEPSLSEGRARIVLRVHPSNFRQEGFVETPDPFALFDLARRHGAIVVDDLGSGALLSTERFGLAHEPTPGERLRTADLVTFSGDKLVGGPQAGLIVGRADLIARLRRDPLARAMRPDKVALAGVAATLGLYRAGLAVREIPVWRSIAARLDDLRARAEALVARLDDPGDGVRVVALDSTVGGGALPGETLPSWGLSLGAPAVTRRASGGSPARTPSAATVLSRLRSGEPAVIARIEDEQVLLDLRMVDPSCDTSLAAAIGSALERSPRRRS
jgi:L-seryl-tRNA(Ser) seleniumtransferase